MNIFHLVSNPVWGGGERYVLDLARAQRADGHTVRVFTRRKPAVSQPFAAEGLHGGFLRLGGALDVLSPIRLAKQLDRAAAAGDVLTVVHTHNFKDAATALRARRLMSAPAPRVKVVCTRHLVKAAPASEGRQRLLAELDAIIFVSQAAMNEFLTTATAAIRRERLHMVHNAIMVPRVPRTERAAAGAPVRMIFCGRIAPEKGIDVLLRALDKIKHLPWELEVCGTGRSREVMPLVRLSRGLGLEPRINWRGFEANVAARMAGADVLVLPSLVPEAFGLVILEAFSQGLPVVTTDSGAQPEIVDDGVDGLLVPKGDPDALAAALERLIADPAYRRTLAANAVAASVGTHAYSHFYNKILDIYRQ